MCGGGVSGLRVLQYLVWHGVAPEMPIPVEYRHRDDGRCARWNSCKDTMQIGKHGLRHIEGSGMYDLLTL